MVLAATSSDLDLSKIGVGLVIEALEDHTPQYDIADLGGDFKTFSLLHLQENVTKFHPSTILRDLQACHDFDITDQLGSIKMPAFVIVGEDDDITTQDMARKLEAALPRADVAVVKEAHHRPMVEEPAAFNKMFRSFINWVQEKEV